MSGTYAQWGETWVFLNTFGNCCLGAALLFFGVGIVRVIGGSRRVAIVVGAPWLLLVATLILFIALTQFLFVIAVYYDFIPLEASCKAVSGVLGLVLCVLRDYSVRGTDGPGRLFDQAH